MLEGKWFAPGENIRDALYVREQVFQAGTDALDPLSWNTVVYLDKEPVATGRIWWQEGDYWFGDIGVLEAFRGQRLGDLVLRLLLFKAQSHSAPMVRLRCPEELEGFFSRLGLRKDPADGTMFLRGAEIDLDTCHSCKNCDRQGCPNRKP